MLSIPGYQLRDTLHDGTRNRVCRAIRKDGVPVVLKLHGAEHPDPTELARFRREYDLLRDLNAPGVVKTYGLEHHGWFWIIVLEDFDGYSLDRIVKTRTLSVAEKLQIAIGAVTALGELHERNIIHKDVSPANVVANVDKGVVKLIDLGLSTVLPREIAGIRNLGALEGTLRYISPEQTGRVNRAIDYRSDLYSLGATLYEFFTGHPPFAGQDPMELVHSHIARRPVEACEREPLVPKAVSNVIMKLLAKVPEARYQSTRGLVRDFEQCLNLVRRGAEDQVFELATHDRLDRFQVPQVLYGRTKEVQALLAAFEEVSADASGNAQVLSLITGYSGIGKSSLVRELYEPITRRRGFFAAGKFDQLEKSRPYSAFASVFGSLVKVLLGESEQSLANWRQKISNAVGVNGWVATDVVPELELIIGKQPHVPDLGPTESQNRFNTVFGGLIHVFAQPEHPLVIFLDDLQWADSGSLKLLEILFQDEQPKCFFVIGAYRDHEVDANHPLTLTLRSIEGLKVPIRKIPLAPLQQHDITKLVVDTVGRSEEEAAPLAEIVVRTTEGNPLFVTEFLRSLYSDGLLDFDRASGRWRWDINKIASRKVAEDVVSLMVGKLERLPAETLRAVQLAACIGATFDAKTLASVMSMPVVDVFRLLLPALQAGFLAASGSLSLADTNAPNSPLIYRELRFVHDRIQQAAYRMIPEAERDVFHLRVGRLLLEAGGAKRDDDIFGVVDQLNRARALMAKAEEKQLARLNLEAAQKARRSLAYDVAKQYLEVGIACLGPDAWDQDYDLSILLHKELGSIQFLSGDYEASEAQCKKTLESARTPLDKGDVYITLVNLNTMRARYAQVLEDAKVGLGLFGIELPLHMSQEELGAAIGVEFGEIDQALGGRDIQSLRDGPEMTDPAARTVAALLQKILPATFLVGTTMYVVIVCKAIAYLLRNGHAPACVDLFSNYGHIVNAARNDYVAAYDFGKLAVDLSERFGRPDCKCRSAYHLADWIAPLSHPLQESDALNELAYRSGIEGGDRVYAGYTLIWWQFNKLYEGRPLLDVLQGVKEALEFAKKTANQIAIDILSGLRLMLANLIGSAEVTGEFKYEEYDEITYLKKCRESNSTMAIATYFVLKQEVLYCHDDWAGVLDAHEKCSEVIAATLGWYAVDYHMLYEALARVALYGSASEETKAKTEEIFDKAKARFEVLAKSCPQNYEHLLNLLLGEIAAAKGEVNRAAEHLELAIEGARRYGFTQYVALASEKAANLWMNRGHSQLAMFYLREALHAHRLRGAMHRITTLEKRHPLLARPTETKPVSVETIAATFSVSTSQKGAGFLDLHSVLRAYQAISSEIVLDKLLINLMEILIENAGAQRGAIVLYKAAQLVVSVDASVEDSGAQSKIVGKLISTPIDRYDGASEEVVRYVARSREIVMLGDASAEGAFTKSAHIVRNRTKSLLCAPIATQGRVVGVLYLENDLTVGTFTRERLEVIRMLSSQIAIAIENALLYHEIEERVEERTLELQQRNGQLQESLENLRRTQGQLVQAEKMASLGRLTLGIAHEIKNPLNFINNFAALDTELVEELTTTLRDEPDTRLGDVEDVLQDLAMNTQKIQQHGIRADDIVKTMLRHGGTPSVDRREADLNSLVEDFVKLSWHASKTKTGSIEIGLERDYDAAIGHLLVVPQELGRAILNLVDNAIDAVRFKFQALGDPSYQPKIRIQTRKRNDSVVISIEDNGEGVAAKVRNRIFEPFCTTRPPGLGTGLGLSLGYDIVVNGHGGTIHFDSVEGQGSTFYVTIPIRAKESVVEDAEK